MTRLQSLTIPLFALYVATLPIQLLILALYVHPVVAVFIYPGLVAAVRIHFEWTAFKWRYRQLAREEPPPFRTVMKLVLKQILRRRQAC